MTFSTEEVLDAFEEYFINEKENISLLTIYEIINEFRKYLKDKKIDYFIASERG